MPSAVALYHGLETVDFYLALRDALQKSGGAIQTWLTEREACYRFDCTGSKLLLTPDSYCLWVLGCEEGSFFLEWDRGTESLARLREKFVRYAEYYAARAYHMHLGDIGLRPRVLLVVVDQRRARRVANWIARERDGDLLRALPTILVGVEKDVLQDVLGSIWRTAGAESLVRLTD
jgi:hypothetical protein